MAGIARQLTQKRRSRRDKATGHHPANDLVCRNFMAGRPNELWVADISVPQQAA
jgi:hypothetical protein